MIYHKPWKWSKFLFSLIKAQKQSTRKKNNINGNKHFTTLVNCFTVRPYMGWDEHFYEWPVWLKLLLIMIDVQHSTSLLIPGEQINMVKRLNCLQSRFYHEHASECNFCFEVQSTNNFGQFLSNIQNKRFFFRPRDS